MSCRVFLLNGKRKRWKSTIYYTSDREERWFLVAINHQHVQWEPEWCLKSDIWISVTWHDHINHTVSPGVPWDTYCEGGPETHDGNDGCQVDPASLLSGDVTSCDVLPSYQTTLVYQYIIYTSVLCITICLSGSSLSHIMVVVVLQVCGNCKLYRWACHDGYWNSVCFGIFSWNILPVTRSDEAITRQEAPDVHQ